MTFEEYLRFLDEYWAIFGPIPSEKVKPIYRMVKL